MAKDNDREKEGVARDKDRRKKVDRGRKSEAKVSFLKQYYPDAHSSLGGSLRIRKITKQSHTRTDDNRAGNPLERNTLETSSHFDRKPRSTFSNRRMENIHMGETFSSPSKKQELN